MMAKKEKDVEQTTDQTTDQAQVATDETTADVPGLELQDLSLILNLVSVAIKRGTFERSELRSVLDVTDKLESFLQYQAQAQAQARDTNSTEGE